MKKISISVLGSPIIGIDRTIAKKATALLIYLAMAAGPVKRTVLSDLLWPYQSPEQSRHSLRNCLLELRKKMGLEAASTHLCGDFTISWLSEFDLDLTAFSELSSKGNYLLASRLLRGEFLSGFHIPSDPWDEWVAARRAEIQRTVIETLLKAARSPDIPPETAVELAFVAIKSDEFNEQAHRVYLRALATNKQRTTAVVHYKYLRHVLCRELGVAPEEATISLMREILEEDLSARKQVDPGTSEYADMVKLGRAMIAWVDNGGSLRKSDIRRAGEMMCAFGQQMGTGSTAGDVAA